MPNFQKQALQKLRQILLRQQLSRNQPAPFPLQQDLPTHPLCRLPLLTNVPSSRLFCPKKEVTHHHWSPEVAPHHPGYQAAIGVRQVHLSIIRPTTQYQSSAGNSSKSFPPRPLSRPRRLHPQCRRLNLQSHQPRPRPAHPQSPTLRLQVLPSLQPQPRLL